MSRFPEWIKKPVPSSEHVAFTRSVLDEIGLNTVCRSAHCPNQAECFANKTATFMILGKTCTRNCTFCAVEHGQTQTVDPQEPQKIVQAAQRLGLKHVVITSVTRDDLPDGGASQFAQVIKELKENLPNVAVEVLTPDFKADIKALQLIAEAKPLIFNHNIETVPGLYYKARPQANYKQSLSVLETIKKLTPDIYTKSGLMVGLNEKTEEVKETIKDIRAVGVDILTIGQYLQPTSRHIPISEFVNPEKFKEYKEFALGIGFKFVASGPFVRSSFKAVEFTQTLGIFAG